MEFGQASICGHPENREEYNNVRFYNNQCVMESRFYLYLLT